MTDTLTMHDIHVLQRSRYFLEPCPDLVIRINRIDRLMALMLNNAEAFADAMSADFGHRAREQSLLTDVLGVLKPIEHTRKHVARWMRPTSVNGFLCGLVRGRARIDWVPRGVVGIIVPWSFPLGLAAQPLATAFAAGNRAMVKMSEFTPRTGELFKAKIAEYFAPDEVSVFTGGPEVGADFSRLPFDLLFFTGASSIARQVQRAAAENLVPTVLELGGKSPVVVDRSADLEKVAKRLAVGKTLNAGQICLSPDHVYIPAGLERDFVRAFDAAVAEIYPRLLDNPDYTSIINQRHHQRLIGYLDDARAKGACLHEVNPAQEDFSRQEAHKMAPVALTEVNDDMLVMQEEIFGPLLPVLVYNSLACVISHINQRPRPLALYYFGAENDNCQKLLRNTISGGVTINDLLLHVSNEDLPFGGVGESGMGYYHGRFGFETFSHARSVVSAPHFSPNALIAPPYTSRKKKFVQWVASKLKRKSQGRIQQYSAGQLPRGMASSEGDKK